MYAPLCIWLLLHLVGITSCFVSLPILSSSTDSVHVHSLLSSSIETHMNYDKMISHESLELLLLSLILPPIPGAEAGVRGWHDQNMH